MLYHNLMCFITYLFFHRFYIQNLPLETSKVLYEKLVRRFPNSGRYWRLYIEQEVFSTFDKCSYLLVCVFIVWKYSPKFACLCWIVKVSVMRKHTFSKQIKSNTAQNVKGVALSCLLLNMIINNNIFILNLIMMLNTCNNKHNYPLLFKTFLGLNELGMKVFN
jgi:hypothetical protein